MYQTSSRQSARSLKWGGEVQAGDEIESWGSIAYGWYLKP